MCLDVSVLSGTDWSLHGLVGTDEPQAVAERAVCRRLAQRCRIHLEEQIWVMTPAQRQRPDVIRLSGSQWTWFSVLKPLQLDRVPSHIDPKVVIECPAQV
eukprot:1414342-Rhodomonas_salina.4